jgi:hypothetical protein
MLPVVVGLVKISSYLWRAQVLKISTLLAKWEIFKYLIFKYLYLVVNKVQNKFQELMFQEFILDTIKICASLHIWKRNIKSINFTCYNSL